MVGLVKDGDIEFTAGMNSVADPTTLPPSSYAYSVNMVNRGGALQTRPGYRHKFTLPAGKLQGLAVYTPRRGKPVLVAIVGGVAYASSYPFTSYREISGAHLSPKAERVYHAQAAQSVERNPDDSLRFIPPRALLMLQDGTSPACYFDGRVTTAVTGARNTPQGTHMAWAGSRLWVARRDQVFASDIANPLSFAEQETNTLGGISYFILPGLCTGMAPLPGTAPTLRSPLLAYTDSTTSSFRADILNRSLWSEIDDFQSSLFPHIGCVAPRSLVAQSGMLWWFSEFGQVRLDSAHASSVSSRIDFIDREMVRSAGELHDDLSGVCSATFENFLLTSVPNADLRNKHTWVFDSSTKQSMREDSPPVWSSVWTGVQPVEWAKLKINGSTRLFCASADADGVNRVYEAFTPDRRDNGCDFPWSFETRGYTAGGLTPKHFRFVEYSASELAGEVNLKVSWAGASRGRWKPIATRTFQAREGNVTGEITATTPLFALKRQSRIDRTEDARDLPEDALSSAGVEGPVEAVKADKEAIDSAFQCRFDGSGPCAVRTVRVFMDLEAEPDSGAADEPESDDHLVRFDGGAARDEDSLQVQPQVWTATASRTAKWKNYAATATATINSAISQADATKRAGQVAQARAEEAVRQMAEPYQGGSLA